ncbi:MAG: hypothetical protein U1E83_06905 [Methylotetracoccus sp.]
MSNTPPVSAPRASLPAWAGLFFFAALTQRLSYDGDVFWHIATGRWILEHGTVPARDVFSYTVAGAPWTAHEWLAALVFACTEQHAGWPGLLVLTAAAAALAYALILRFLLLRLQPLYAVPLTALAFFLSLHHFLLRPHVLAMPVLVAWSAEMFAAADEHRAPKLSTVLLMSLWANLHGSFVLGLALCAYLGVEAVMTAAPDRRLRLAGRWSRFIALALIAALLTPQGLRGLEFPLLLYGQPALLNMIDEWRAPDFHEPQALEVWLLLAMGFLMSARIRVPPSRMLLVLGFVHMGLHHIRHVTILGMLSPLALAEPLRRWGAGEAAGRWTPTSFNGVCRRLASTSGWRTRVALTVLTALAIAAPYARGLGPRSDEGPLGAIRQARSMAVTGPVLNAPIFGGHLIYSGIPPFIDGRFDLYGGRFVSRYVAAINLSDGRQLETLLDQWGIEWTLFEPYRPINAWLDRSGGWKRIYEDATAVAQIRCHGPC